MCSGYYRRVKKTAIIRKLSPENWIFLLKNVKKFKIIRKRVLFGKFLHFFGFFFIFFLFFCFFCQRFTVKNRPVFHGLQTYHQYPLPAKWTVWTDLKISSFKEKQGMKRGILRLILSKIRANNPPQKNFTLFFYCFF